MKQLLKEYYINIYPKDSGIPLTIWIDNCQAYKKGGHSYRIKFEYNGELIPMMMPSMEIPNAIAEKLNIKTSVLNAVKEFCEKNFDVIMAAKDGISTEELKTNIKSVNDTDEVKIEELSNDDYTLTKHSFNGFTLVKNNAAPKYNFVSKDGKLVSSVWFDKCDGGFVNIDGVLIAFVQIDGEWHKLYPNGEIVNI